MKYRTETVREGEELGPVDWTHPMVAEARIPAPDLRDVAEHPELWEATTDGGWPRFGWRQVERLVMYDGWPYWKPHPVFVMSGGPLGGIERHSFDSVTEVRAIARATRPTPESRCANCGCSPCMGDDCGPRPTPETP